MNLGDLMSLLQPFVMSKVRMGITMLGMWLIAHHGLDGMGPDAEKQFTGACLLIAAAIWNVAKNIDVAKLRAQFKNLQALTAKQMQIEPTQVAAMISQPASRPNVTGADMNKLPLNNLYPILLAIAFAPIFLGPALAADVLPSKKAPAVITALPAPAACTLQSCSGWVVDFSMMGQGSNLNIVGAGIANSVFAGGGAIGIGGGYQWWNGTFYFEPNVRAYYDFSPNTTIAGISTAPSGKYLITEGVKAGAPISTLFGNAPPIMVPTNIANALISPYVQFGAAERPWGVGWYIGAGAEFLLASDATSAWLLDIDYKAITYSNDTVSSSALGAATLGTENWVGATVSYKFK